MTVKTLFHEYQMCTHSAYLASPFTSLLVSVVHFPPSSPLFVISLSLSSTHPAFVASSFSLCGEVAMTQHAILITRLKDTDRRDTRAVAAPKSPSLKQKRRN